MKLKADEYKLSGSWILANSILVLDDVATRIEYLTSTYLKKLATDDSGWCTLFQDPSDNRYWELTYPESELQGGGPLLQNIKENEATIKYHIS